LQDKHTLSDRLMAEGGSAGLIRHLLVDGRGCVRWVNGRCPSDPHPSFTRWNIHRLAFTELGPRAQLA